VFLLFLFKKVKNSAIFRKISTVSQFKNYFFNLRMSASEFCGTSVAAKKLGLSVGTVQALVEKNELLAWKTEGGHRRISLQSIADYQKRAGKPNGTHKDPAGPLKVLLVDADTQTFEAIERVRQQAGIPVECIWITSAFKALINLQAIQPDILIADLSMANVDGYDLLSAVRASHDQVTMALVGLTTEDPSKLIELGTVPVGTALVQKPAPPEWFQGYFASHIGFHKSAH
jgi:excisionase family DNA binding protein